MGWDGGGAGKFFPPICRVGAFRNFPSVCSLRRTVRQQIADRGQLPLLGKSDSAPPRPGPPASPGKILSRITDGGNAAGRLTCTSRNGSEEEARNNEAISGAERAQQGTLSLNYSPVTISTP